MKHKLIDSINNNKVIILSGDTGCGKSTQMIKYIYEDYLKNPNKNYEFNAIIT